VLRLVIITYNDMPLIEKCVSSVIDHVDSIVAIDGIFSDFPRDPGEPGYSTDGTLEYLSSLDKEVSLAICPDLEEVEKRNLYLIGEPGDWYLMLDTDEWVENPEVLEDLPDYDALFCPMIREGGVTSSYARLFRHVEGLHYEGLHYRLLDGQGRLLVTLRQAGEDYRTKKFPLVIQHDREKRSKERIKAKHQYYHVLTAKEKQVKEMLRYG
jgi:hypothetical protein